MSTLNRNTWFRKTLVAGILPLAALSVSGCTPETEQGAGPDGVVEDDAGSGERPEEDLPEPYEGPYVQEFYDEIDTYEGQEVTLTASVQEIVTPRSFTISGEHGSTVENLLVVHNSELPDLDSGVTVEVAGVVHEKFDLPTVEEEESRDLDDPAFEDWGGEPYIDATTVDTSAEFTPED